MLQFTLKFIGSMIRDNFRELCLVLVGITLCLCLLINSGDSMLTIENVYSDTTDEEAVTDFLNRVFFVFSDADGLEKITKRLMEQTGVRTVYADGYAGTQIRCGSRMPLIRKQGILTGSIPNILSQGQIITSHDLLTGSVERWDTAPESESGELGVGEDEGLEKPETKEFIAQGDKIRIAGKDFVNVAEIAGSEGHIVTIEDFIELYKESGSGGITFSYVYEKGFTEEQKQEIEALIRTVKKPEKVYEVDHSIQFLDFTEMAREELLGLIIASLNALFLYVYLLKKRIPVYTVLKLQGLTNGRLRGMLLAEFLFVYLVACLLSAAAYGSFARIVGRQMVFFKEVYLYSVACVFVINLVLFSLVTWKLVRKQPYELYQERE